MSGWSGSGTATGNFELTPEQAARKQAAIDERDAAHKEALEYHPGGSKAGIGIGGMKDAINAHNRGNDADARANNAVTDAQAENAGVQRSDTQVGKGGIEGFFGGKEVGSLFTAGNVQDSSTDSNQQRINDRIASISGRQNQTMQAGSSQAAGSTASQLASGQVDQTRARQNAMLDSMAGAANGSAPSAANATLQSATDRNLAASLAGAAAAGGTPAAARAAAFQRAQITQDAGAQSAALRANEMATARGQLATAAQGVREQDISVAGQNAQLTQQTSLSNASNQQQTNLANANNQQQTNQTNLLSGIEQQQQRDQQIGGLMAQGFTLDEARRQTEIQQRQFNASLLAQQEAAKMGVSSQNAASAGQAGAATLSAVASTAAAFSDERAKKSITTGDANIEKMLDSMDKEATPKGPSIGDRLSDAGKALSKSFGAMGSSGGGSSAMLDRATSSLGSMTEQAASRARSPMVSDKKAKKNISEGDGDTEAFLDSLHAKEYDYKNPAHGEGRRVGIMAQDMEKTPMGKSAVIDNGGLKMIDLNKSVSAALAGLANINKRLREIEA